ncbi:3-oxoacyl-[acyl-carrier-protein] synthase-1 [Nitrosospira sp. Nsp5]|uniref:3-oxoacyl-[acyl-carrier-protein] synthase-1 n=1 Tax=Nitrosospira multiformis TaxID=1231 RepID=A0ABY0TDT9_9PROT|nr:MULTISPECIES: 3-oxoacyl-ACP synthase [Nitrosospira]PTR08970.1 3-oxoacyl-[acyl-carrier-protein] synthase-1 [Nitrosospira sp. Nsp5]SDQ68073.1 3-oxoacyl-[acyl-carrier-protein] synthase-1 [Nitrosospira multiformis]
MSCFPLAITGTGLVTGVGLNAEASCAAIRCAIDNFQETRFMDKGGEWIMGSEVPLEQPWRGKSKLLKMATAAINECLVNNKQIAPKSTPLLLCLSEHERKGRIINDDNQFFLDLQDELGVEFHEQSRVIAQGQVSIAIALKHARVLLQESEINYILIAATDSLLVGSTLSHYEKNERLLTSQNSNGFIPGEAGAALLIEPVYATQENKLVCHGLGFGVEKAHVYSEEPLRADGLTAAIKESLDNAGYEMGDLDFRVTGVSGEQYYFKEASLTLLRLLRERKEEFDIWHPADCIGEIGAVMGVAMVAVLKSACEKGYAKGNHILAHLGNDYGKRSSMIFSWQRADSQ